MNEQNQKELGKILWAIADELRGAMNADDFRDYMLSFLFLRYLSDNYEETAKKELGKDYPKVELNISPLSIWYENNPKHIDEFEKQMRRKVHYVIQPEHLWASISEMARRQDKELLNTLSSFFFFPVVGSWQSRVTISERIAEIC